MDLPFDTLSSELQHEPEHFLGYTYPGPDGKDRNWVFCLYCGRPIFDGAREVCPVARRKSRAKKRQDN